MTDQEKLAAVVLRLPNAESGLLSSLLAEAKAHILSTTGRESIPPQLDWTQIKLAVIAYNRLGIEGQSTYSEGGISLSVDSIPDAIRAEITPYRLARTAR